MEVKTSNTIITLDSSTENHFLALIIMTYAIYLMLSCGNEICESCFTNKIISALLIGAKSVAMIKERTLSMKLKRSIDLHLL